jgi:GNAT superfamily N-acetyltransferase
MAPASNSTDSSFYDQFKFIANTVEAAQVSEFLLGEDCFDDQLFTPGEKHLMRVLPLRSISEQDVICWYAEEAGKVVAAIIFVENELRCGGFRLEYFGVHRAYRHRGYGTHMLQRMFQYCNKQNGRYIETYTSDLPEYAKSRKLFEYFGFQLMCHLPHYYFPGEGKMVYYKLL